MNIFEILCYGDGRVTEPQMSSVLAFVLDPTGTHGYKFHPLEKFIDIFFSQGEFTFAHLGLKKRNEIHKWLHSFKLISLDLEVISIDESTEKRSDLDLVIRFYKESVPEFTIIVENKINDGASRGNKKQLVQQYFSLRKELDSEIDAVGFNKEVPIIYVYLTPKPVTDPKMSNSFKQWDELKLSEIPVDGKLDFKVNIAWNNSKSATLQNDIPSIKNILQNLLNDERGGVINPGSSHSDLLFRSLIKFINNDFKREDYTLVEHGDNNFTVIQEDVFWKAWGEGGKKGAKLFAQNIIGVIKNRVEELLQEGGYSSRFELKVVTSKLRLNLYLDDMESPHNVNSKSPKGRIFNLRYDGKTTGDNIDITFDRADGHEFKDFISQKKFSNIKFLPVKVFDSSGGQFRTILHLSVATISKELTDFLNGFISEAVETAIARFE